MDDKDRELKEQIKNSLYRHGKLSLLFYKTMDEWMVHKWGEFDCLSQIHQELFAKYTKAGFVEEAESLTLMDLPNDVDTIFKILTCGSLEKILKEIGYIK
jgi:hypothetical protein